MWDVTTKFWETRDAWASATQARQAARVAAGGKAAKYPTMVNQARKWSLNAERYLSTRKGLYQAAMASVEVPAELQLVFMRLIGNLSEELTKAYDAELGSVAFRAWREWPVLTGLSKSSITLQYTQEGDTFIGAIGNSAPYVYFIANNPRSNLIRLPAMVAAGRIVERIKVSGN